MQGFPVVVPIPVRYRDLDTFNHVNNAVFLTYFEVARVAYFRELARVYPGDRFRPVVVRAEVDYKRSIRLEDEVRVGVRVARVGGTSFTMAYRVEANGHLAAEGKTVHAWLGEDWRPARIPEPIRARIRDFETLPVEGL